MEGVGGVVNGGLFVPITGIACTSVNTLVAGSVPTCNITCHGRVKVLRTVAARNWSSHWSFLKIVT